MLVGSGEFLLVLSDLWAAVFSVLPLSVSTVVHMGSNL